MSPISFSDKFLLLSLKGSQKLIGKSSLGVVVDNIKFLFSDENLRIPDLLTLLSLCFGTKRACDLNLPFLIPRLVSALTGVWKPVLVKTLTAVCSFL